MEAKLFHKYDVQLKASGGPRSEREELLDLFMARVNGDRQKAGYPAWPIGRFLRMFKGWKTEELYPLYKRCMGADKFGALLKWELEQRKSDRDIRPKEEATEPLHVGSNWEQSGCSHS